MYAINLFENSYNIPMPVINSLASQHQDYQQSAHKTATKMQQALTHEQSRIVNHEIKTDHVRYFSLKGLYCILFNVVKYINILANQDCGVCWEWQNYHTATIY